MIPFDIAFLQPESVEEAAAAFRDAVESGRRPRWFSGGTELVTSARERESFDVLIDLKRIPEYTQLDLAAGIIGGGTRISKLADQADVPLLSAAARGIADRTVRNSITAAGNICGMLPYRELVLPLLLCDAEIVIAGPSGVRSERLSARFSKRLLLEPAEFLLAVHLQEKLPDGYYERRTRDARVDYPLATLCMARIAGDLRLAAGGVHGYPVRSPEAERVLAAGGASPRALAEATVDAVTDPIRDDFRASSDYRRELFVQALERGITELENA